MSLPILLFALWSFLWAGYFMLDGFDFGAGELFVFLGRNEPERRLIINSIGPVWSGNEVWLITAGGVTFAAFPAAYAGILSSFYLLFALTLAALICRGVIFEFRSRMDGAGWRRTWDTAFTAGSVIPAFLFGVIFGNIFRGMDLGSTGFTGSFLSYFNPYALVTGILFLAVFAHHGATWLAVKTGGGMRERAEKFAGVSWYVLVAIGAGFAVYTGSATHLYDNYVNHPAWYIVPALLAAALIINKYMLVVKNSLGAFLSSCQLVVLTIFFAIVGLYPNLLPSTSGVGAITVSGAAASDYALGITAGMVIAFMPLVIAYQLWVYGVFRNRLLAEEVDQDEDAY